MKAPTADAIQLSVTTRRPASRAPLGHTVCVLLLLGLLVLMSTRIRSIHPSDHREVGYVVVILAEWLITAFIWLGDRRRGVSTPELADLNAPGWKPFLRDVGIAIGLLIAANVALSVFGHLIHAAPNRSLRNFLPRSSAEKAVYLLMAVTASICEEIIYRGYLQKQFAYWTRSSVAGVIFQSIAFGASHQYQGWRMAASISVFGCIFGFVAVWRRSLRPGIMAHFLQDGVGGLLLARQA
jgi:membrane protease YdiL (CAAX protease family)